MSSREAAECRVLGVLLSWRGCPPTPSWQPCADAPMKPLHSLTFLSPSSHSPARQNPAIVPSHGGASSQTHTRTVFPDGFQITYMYKNTSVHLAKKSMQCRLFADGSPVFPTVCPPISSQWKPSTSLNPNSLCVFTHTDVCCCASALCKSLSTLASLTIVSKTCPAATVISSH